MVVTHDNSGSSEAQLIAVQQHCNRTGDRSCRARSAMQGACTLAQYATFYPVGSAITLTDS